jgi:hypothetical protein
MRFTIGTRARTLASAFNPTAQVVITDYNPNVFDAQGNCVPLQVRRFDGQPFMVAAALRDGALAVSQHRQAWTQLVHLTVLPNLCEEPEYVPQPVVDAWEVGMAARARAERVTATEASYFVGTRASVLPREG